MTILKDTRNWQVYINDPGVIVEGVEDIAQCIYTAIMTVQGSDPLRVDFGSKVYKYIDQPMTVSQPNLIYEATEAVRKWEKRVQLKKCTLESDGIDSRKIVIEAVVIASAAQITIKINV